MTSSGLCRHSLAMRRCGETACLRCSDARAAFLTLGWLLTCRRTLARILTLGWLLTCRRTLARILAVPSAQVRFAFIPSHDFCGDVRPPRCALDEREIEFLWAAPGHIYGQHGWRPNNGSRSERTACVLPLPHSPRRTDAHSSRPPMTIAVK
jgi:ribosomal protein L29